MQFILQNWAWVSSVALPFSEPLQTAQGTAANLSHLSIALIVLASIQALGLVNVLSLLSRRGALALVPFAAHVVALALGGITVGAGFHFGPTACLASPEGCLGVKLLLLSALLLVLLTLVRLLLAPDSPARWAAYTTLAVLTTALYATSAALCGSAAQSAHSSVLRHWPFVEQQLPAMRTPCTGQRSELFAAHAVSALAILTALASAALLVLLLLLLLAAYTYWPTRPCWGSWRSWGSGWALGGGGANRVGVEPLAGSSSSSRYAAADEAWWWAPPPKRYASEPLIPPVADSHAGGPHAAADGSGPSDAYHTPLRLEERFPAGLGEGAGMTGGGRDARTSMMSNLDDNGPAQILLANASLIPRWCVARVPRLSCSARVLLLLIGMGAAYVAAAVFFDSTAAATIPFGGRSRQTVSRTLTFSADTADVSTTLRVTNRFERGVTQVLFSKDRHDEVTVHLTVDTASPLADAVRLVNTSCSPTAPWASGACSQGASVSMLNITAEPPPSCDEHCGWYWLWYPCRCHAFANLTVILPAGSSANMSHLNPFALISALLSGNAYSHFFVDVAVDSPGPSVRVAPLAPGLSHILDRLAVTSRDGDVSIERTVALSGLTAISRRGIARLEGIVAGGSVNATGALLAVDSVVVAQPCVFLNYSVYGVPLRGWYGGTACGAVPTPDVTSLVNGTKGAPIAVAMGPLYLQATGGLGIADVVLNGTIGASDAYVTTAGGRAVLNGARFAGGLDVDMGRGAGQLNMVNVMTLDCSFCKELDLLAGLPWAELPLAAGLPLFCTCDTQEVEGARGIRFRSSEAKLVAAFVIANAINARSTYGDLGFDEIVLTPSKPSRNGSVGTAGPPTLVAYSDFGAVALNGLISGAQAAAEVHVDLGSSTGDVKAVFSGGALNGSYEVVTESGGIGHTGIVIDNEMSTASSGTIGTGNASVRLFHSYGDVALALSTKAPSVFEGITGRTAVRARRRHREGDPRECSEPSTADDGQDGQDVELPAAFAWMHPSAPELGALLGPALELHRLLHAAPQSAATE